MTYCYDFVVVFTLYSDLISIYGHSSAFLSSVHDEMYSYRMVEWVGGEVIFIWLLAFIVESWLICVLFIVQPCQNWVVFIVDKNLDKATFARFSQAWYCIQSWNAVFVWYQKPVWSNPIVKAITNTQYSIRVYYVSYQVMYMYIMK